MVRRLRDVLVFNLAAVYGWHISVAAVRYLLSRRGLGVPEPCAEPPFSTPPRRRGWCSQ